MSEQNHPIPEKGVVMHADRNGDLWKRPYADSQLTHPVLVLPLTNGRTHLHELLEEAREAIEDLANGRTIRRELVERIAAALKETT